MRRELFNCFHGGMNEVGHGNCAQNVRKSKGVCLQCYTKNITLHRNMS